MTPRPQKRAEKLDSTRITLQKYMRNIVNRGSSFLLKIGSNFLLGPNKS